MPVEIKELVIRAVVQQEGERPAPARGAPPNERLAAEERQAIVQATVMEVLRILKESKGR
ncbi:MAG TPA: DUF5908 family protein [Polyangiaceae bacterium]|jgi:hypothetical protein|nr:DUF5908 family protein [Polyangiaceae bacterium]